MKIANFGSRSRYGYATGGDVTVIAYEVMRSLPWKEPVRAASTANVALTSEVEAGDSLDGITLVAGDRILLKNQTDASENGIYIVASTGAPDRAVDFDESDEILGAYVPVAEGTANAGKLFRNTNTTTIVVDTDDITFEEFTASITVAEEDGTPTVTPVDTIEVPVGGLEDDGGGTISLHYEQNKNGGRSQIQSHGSMGATETFDATNGNVHTGTLNADCTFTLTSPASGAACVLELYITQDGTGGWDITWPASVVWQGGSMPTIDTTAGTLTRYVIETLDGGTTWYAVVVGAGGSASPLTTKGDLWGYSTLDARVPVGTDTHLLNADSTAALGVAYIAPADVVETAGHWEPLMDGGSPYEPLDDGSGTDWLFVWVP